MKGGSGMTNRRNFIATMLAAGAAPALRAHAEGIGTWPGWKKGEFQIHAIYTGVAESQFLVFPDGTTMLLDCGDHPALTRLELSVPVKPNPGRLAGDWIARYVKRVNPNGDQVDYMVASHWHSDHTGTPRWTSSAPTKIRTGLVRSGFGLAVEQLRFKKAIDRGWPDYDDPIPYSEGAGDTGVLDLMKAVYAYLAKRDGLKVEKFLLGAKDQIVPLRGNAEGFCAFNLCANGKIAMPDGSVRNVYADQFENGRTPSWLNENGMSLGNVFTYGKFRYYTAADFSDCRKNLDGSERMIEDDMAAAVSAVSVAKMNHHGHWSMPGKLIQALRPKVWLACVWDQLHTVPNTLERISNRAFYAGRKDVLVCPGVFPSERVAKESSKPYFKDIVPECHASGCHMVVNVAPGGDTFTVTFLSAEDESMKILGSRSFVS